MEASVVKNQMILGSKATHPVTIGCYILDSLGRPVAEPDFLKWTAWLQTTERVVARDEIPHDFGPIRISTVFLGLAHHFTGAGRPVLWESLLVFAPPTRMVIGVRIPDLRLAAHHYTSRKTALTKHQALVRAAIAGRYDLLLQQYLFAHTPHPS